MDRIAVVALSFAACVIMSILLPWCLVCNIPIVGELFDQLSRRVCNGLSIVNACTSSLLLCSLLPLNPLSISNDIRGTHL